MKDMSSSNSRYQPIAPLKKPPQPNEQQATQKNRACDACRQKKIKCQKMEGASTCKNCISYEKGCTYSMGSKKRGPPRGYVSILESRLARIEGLITNISENLTQQLPSPERSTELEEKKSEESKDDTTRAFIEEIKNTDLASEGKYVSGSGVSYILTRKIKHLKNSELVSLYGLEIQHNENSDYFYVQKSRKAGDRRKEQIKELITFGLLKPNETVDSIDEWIFRVAGISKVLSDKLLKVYFAYIHPQLPVVNKTAFLEEYRGIRETFPSAPLLNAMYGTAVRYIDNCKQFGDSESLNQGESWDFPYNFSHILFQNLIIFIKRRYAPCLSSIQAIVLAYNHSASIESWTSGWLLNCIAMRMSQDIGLHRSTDGWDLTPEDKETRRTVWWSVYLLDRWVSAGTGRPLTAFDEDCDEIYPSESVSVNDIMDTMTDKDQTLPRFPSLDIRIADKISESTIPLNLPFVQLVKLSKILGQILQGLYSPRAQRHSAKYGSDAIVARLDKALSDWRTSLPPLLQISRVGENITLNKSHTPIVSMTGMICLCYCNVLILLYRPFIEKSDHRTNIDHPTKNKLSSESSLAICTSAATRIIEVSENMHYRDFLMVSWGFALYPVFTAALIHIYNCSSTDKAISDTAKSNLIRALAVVDRLCLLSPIASDMGSILKKIVNASPFFKNKPSVLATLKIQEELNAPHMYPFETKVHNDALNQAIKRGLEEQADEEESIKRARKENTSKSHDEERINILRSHWFPKTQDTESDLTSSRAGYIQDEDWLKKLYAPSGETGSLEDCVSSKAADSEDAYSISQFGLDVLKFQENNKQQQIGSQQYELQRQLHQVSAANDVQFTPDNHINISDTCQFNSMHENPSNSTIDFSFLECPSYLDDNTLTDATLNSMPSIHTETQWVKNDQINTKTSEISDPAIQATSAQFMHRPGNPFWGMPTSFETEEWRNFIVQYQELMEKQNT